MKLNCKLYFSGNSAVPYLYNQAKHMANLSHYEQEIGFKKEVLVQALQDMQHRSPISWRDASQGYRTMGTVPAYHVMCFLISHAYLTENYTARF